MKRTRRWLNGVSMLVLVTIGLGAACVPDPPAPTLPPVIASFEAITPSGDSPVTTALTWTISDPESNPLSCALDLDGDPAHVVTITNCTSESIRTVTFTDVGVNTVTLEVSNGSFTETATTEVSVGPADADFFDITVRVDPSLDPEVEMLAEAAATRWESVIVAGLPDHGVAVPPGTIFGATPGLDATVDDLYVDIVLDPIDGPGNGLALGGGARFRPDGTTAWGAVAIDSDDYASLLTDPSTFLDTLTHEIGHILFAGPVFSSLVDDSDPVDPRFTGAAATGAYQGLGGVGSVPMDGTAHWRTSIFGSELMTSASGVGVSSQLSEVTAAALADLHYGVDLAGAEAYALPTSP